MPIDQSEGVPEQTLSNKQFVSWRDSDTSASLLVVAPPGRGKSVLSNFVLQHLENQAENDLVISTKTIYYFCNIKEAETLQNARSLLRALVVQLCEHQQSLFSFLLTEYKTKNESFLNESLDTLWNIFERMLQDEAYGRINCIIDGLDVYQDGMDELIDKLSAGILQARRSPILKFFYTSRPGKHLSQWPFKNHVFLRCNPYDLDCFITSRISNLGQSFTEDMREVIEYECSKQADKTFLWLEVVFRKIQLLTFPSTQKIKDTIQKSSHDLFKLYKGLIHDIGGDADAVRLLAWVAYAKERMNLASLEDALAIHLEDQCTSLQTRRLKKARLTVEEVFKACGTILDVIEDKVYFIHQSVKDYFDEEDPLKSLLGIPPRLLPAYACLAYLSSEDFHPARTDFKNFPLLSYAHTNWHRHIESTADVLGSNDLQILLIRLIAPSKLESWTSRTILLYHQYRATGDAYGDVPDMDEIVFNPQLTSSVAIYYDIIWLAELLLENSVAELPNDFSRDYSYCMTRYRYRHVFRVLIGHKSWASVPLESEVVEAIARSQYDTSFEILIKNRGKDVRITSDLIAAAAGNSIFAKQVMNILLRNGGDSIYTTFDWLEKAAQEADWTCGNSMLLLDQRINEAHITSAVLEAAAGNCRSTGDVMITLLSKMGDESKITQDVLKAAASNSDVGHAIMKLLIDRRVRHAARLCITDDLVIEAAKNYECAFEIMSVLLDWQPGKVHITMELEMAIERNWCRGRDIMILLLQRRADDTHVTKDIASRIIECWGDDVMWLIRKRGKDSHFMSRHVTRLLVNYLVCVSSLKNNLDDLETLLALGADANFVSHLGWTPLTSAAMRGDLQVVELLLASKAELSKTTTKGWSPLSLAAGHGRAEVVRLLLNRGAVIDGDGSKPLVFASGYGHVGVIKLLLERRANINATGPDGWTPLAVASSRGHFSAVDLLLENNADVASCDKYGYTPLSRAASRGDVEMVKHLVKIMLQTGADISGSASDRSTPLGIASNNGHLETVKVLLSQGANPLIINKYGWSPLDAAASKGHVRIFKALLLHESLDTVDDKKFRLGTIANTLAFYGHTGLLQYIVQHKRTDLHSTDELGRTPLLCAARSGNVQTFKYLVGQGLPLNTVDAKGDGLTSYAASSGCPELVEVVLGHMTETSHQPGHWSPLHWACRSGNVQVLERIVEAMIAEDWQREPSTIIDLESEWTRKWTPRTIAIFHGNKDMLGDLSEACQAALGVSKTIVHGEGNRNGQRCYFCFLVGKRLVSS